MEDQLDRELRFHLERHTADLIARGVAPDDARRQARLELGGPEQVKEQCRDARGTRWVDDLWQDVRYALRTLRRRPGFAAVALLTLALGSGATTVIFTVMHGVLFKPVPFADPATLLKVDEQTKGIVDYRWGDRWAFSYPNFLDCQRDVRSLDMAAFRYGGGTVSGAGDPEFVDALAGVGQHDVGARRCADRGTQLSAGRRSAGRGAGRRHQPGALAAPLWRRAVGRRRDGHVRGHAVHDRRHRAGDLQRARRGPPDADRAEHAPVHAPPWRASRHHVWARLRPGATRAAAQAELDVVGRNLAAQYPESNVNRGFIAEPLRPNVGGVRSTLWLLMGAVASCC